VIWPIALVARATFADGLGPVLEALSQPEVIFSFQLTLAAAFWAVVLNTVFGCRHLAAAGPLHLPRPTGALRTGRPAALGVPDRGRAGPPAGLQRRTGWIGQSLEAAGLQIIYAPPGIILATAFVSLPLVIRELVPVLTEIGTDQEQAARSLGASPWQAFWRITLPAIKWALLYGVVLSLARSLGEFGAVKVVSGGVAFRTQTATLLVEERYQQFGAQNTTVAYTAAFVLALIAVIALIIVTSLRPKEEHHR
jgi:sulfate transport system permease protein